MTYVFNLPQINFNREITNPKEFNYQQMVFLLAQERWNKTFRDSLQTKRFTSFTFKFQDKVRKIVLICELFNFNIELTVTELFDLQKRVKRVGGLAHWITLEIEYVQQNTEYLSFDH